MKVRKAVSKDIPQINELLYQVAEVHSSKRPDLFRRGSKKYTSEQLEEILADPKRPIFAAVDDNDVMRGYAFCIFQEHKDDLLLTDIKTLYIDDLCVDESCRGTHIGTLLYNAVKDFAAAEGCYNLTLNVWECNPSAMGFYKAMGLEPYKTGMETIL